MTTPQDRERQAMAAAMIEALGTPRTALQRATGSRFYGQPDEVVARWLESGADAVAEFEQYRANLKEAADALSVAAYGWNVPGLLTYLADPFEEMPHSTPWADVFGGCDCCA